MAQKYRKIDPRIWRDEKFDGLTEGEKLVALYCITAQTNRCGIFAFSPAMAAEELGTSPQTFRERFKKVVTTLSWQWDDARRVLYFPTWWKYNPPENANVLTGNLRDMDDLPETPLAAAFYANLKYLEPNLHRTFRERSPKPCPIQEQEQEQEQEQDKESPEPAKPASEPTPAVLEFPTVGAGPTSWALTAAQIDEWSKLYPSLDVLAECRKAKAWVLANPAKRKTAGGMCKFLVNWFNTANDKSGPRGNRPPPEPRRPPNDFARRPESVAQDAQIAFGGAT
jgi:hypothetical protein